MTRINSAIRPELLTDEHLLAEHREIKRLPSVYIKRKNIGFKNLPEKFTLGAGHVLFFVNKPSFTYNRYQLLHNECLKRGFNVDNYGDNWNVYGNGLNLNNYTPTAEEFDLLVDRISDRLSNSKKKCWHYYGNKIDFEKAIKILKTKNNEEKI